MSSRTERLIADTALVTTFVVAFATHENGALLHSLVSLVFTFVALHHVKHNWASYRRPRLRSKAIANQSIAALVVATTITGLIFWIAGDSYALAHGPLSIAAAVAILPHVWIHRRALVRLIKRSSARSSTTAP